MGGFHVLRPSTRLFFVSSPTEAKALHFQPLNALVLFHFPQIGEKFSYVFSLSPTHKRINRIISRSENRGWWFLCVCDLQGHSGHKLRHQERPKTQKESIWIASMDTEWPDLTIGTRKTRSGLRGHSGRCTSHVFSSRRSRSFDLEFPLGIWSEERTQTPKAKNRRSTQDEEGKTTQRRLKNYQQPFFQSLWGKDLGEQEEKLEDHSIC